MIDLEAAVRAAIRDLADEGRPVELGERALAGVRRRHRRTAALVAFAVAAVAAGALVWPHWVTSNAPSPVVMPPDEPVPSVTAEPWPTFAGLGAVPAAPPGSVTDRFVVAAYQTNPNPRGPGRPIHPQMLRMHVLDPATGQYRQPDVDNVLAFSPDLRYALVARQQTVHEEAGGTRTGADEYGIYDTTAGRVLGRLDTDGWVNPPQGWVGPASWSPDGRSLVLSVRLALPEGRGWLAEKLLFVDVRTAAVRAVDIRPAHGLEPLDLLGWTADGTGVALTADRIGADEAPRGHLIYDLAGRPVAAHSWPGQSTPVPAAHADQLALIPISPTDQITVMRLSTGVVQHRYPAGPLRTLPGSQTPLAWRGNELLIPAVTCTSDVCVPTGQVLGVAAATGQSQVLHTLDEPPVHMVVAPAVGLVGSAAAVAW